MEKTAAVLTVFFEKETGFWVGVYERRDGAFLEAARAVFGAEPKQEEVHAFLLANWGRLRFGRTTGVFQSSRRKNPKRLQREIQRQTDGQGVGTKAQQALAALREEQKAERKICKKAEKAADLERRFRQKQEKRKEKHKGH